MTVLNEARTIRETLKALTMQRAVSSYEIVIVDGGSTDGTWEILAVASATTKGLRAFRREEANIRHMKSPVAYGRNAAISLSTGDIIAVTDAGSIASEWWLANLISRLDDPLVDVVYGRCHPKSSTIDRSSRNVAFRRAIWEAYPYPEVYLTAEDTLWNDMLDRAKISWAFEEAAVVKWSPPTAFRSKLRMHYRYGKGDGFCKLRTQYYLTAPLKVHRPWLLVQTAGWATGHMERMLIGR